MSSKRFQCAKKIVVILSSIALSGCASLYVQPPATGNAIVSFVKDNELSYEPTIQAYLDARDCSDRMRNTPAEWIDMTTGKGIVLRAGKEFAVSLEAVRSIKVVMNPSLGTEVESCKSIVSFTPQANQQYRLKFVGRHAGCSIQVLRVVPSESSFVEIPDKSARKREWTNPLMGSACKAD